MSDVIVVAAISSAGALRGAALGSLANVWGPATAERRQREHEREATLRAERQAAALAFTESLPELARADNLPWQLQVRGHGCVSWPR